MDRLSREYSELAEFRIVYIREAHAADGSWPNRFSIDREINEPTTHGNRCQLADAMLEEFGIEIPCLVDGMDDDVGKIYAAHPDRAFLIRKDGLIAIAGRRGPRGFAPALEDIEEWLAEYRETGEEPALGEEGSVE